MVKLDESRDEEGLRNNKRKHLTKGAKKSIKQGVQKISY